MFDLSEVDEVDQSMTASRYDEAPLIQEFKIIGLHGAKVISFDSNESVSILMARNGSGKTTLLAAMNAVLTGNFYRLAHFHFERIDVKIEGLDRISFARSDVELLQSHLSDSSLSKMASDCGVSLEYVLEVAQSVLHLQDPGRYIAHPGIRELNERHPTYGHKTIYEVLVQGISGMYTSVPALAEASRSIAQKMKDYDVVYLPTYRRIEMSLSRYQLGSRPRLPWEASTRSGVSLLPNELKFGLSDIADRLQEIFLEIQRNSNTTYQKISANIINDLLDGSYLTQGAQTGKPDKNELNLFFSRIRASRAKSGSQITIPDIDKIYRDDFDDHVRPFLLYFLNSLNEAILSTKPLEDRVNGFIEASNNYLADDDRTAFKHGMALDRGGDAKQIQINRDSFRPYFTTARGDKKIKIDALSSGEKQVVSLFARLYLYDKRKVILYDEPELSLSIGWQSQLLPDLCRSPDFRQLVAITHSPFVFDNELVFHA